MKREGAGMKPAQLRLVAIVLLYCGWLGYLYYQVQTRPVRANELPLVLSRPQLLVSRLDVIADIKSPRDKVRVVEVLYPEHDAPLKPGAEIQVDNLESCGPLPTRDHEGTPPGDYTNPGTYLLPLQPRGETRGHYEVVPTPPSPGYPPGMGMHAGPPRIYPASAETRAEYEKVRPHKP